MQLPVKTAALLLMALCQGACATRPTSALVPVQAAAEATQVRVLAVTTRKASVDAQVLFGGERALATGYADLTVSIPPNRKPGEIVWSTTVPPDSRTSFAAIKTTLVDERGFRNAFRGLSSTRKPAHVLVFVHGYNTRFDEALFRFAQVTHDAGGNSEVIPVLFSWPSWGKLSTYAYDRESAAVSRDSLANLLLELSNQPSIGHITILAHSMGGWLTMEAMRTIALRRGDIPRKINDLMLAAPDIDVDVAISQGKALTGHRPRITLFTSRDDRALGLSRLAWGSRAQLGAIDVAVEPYRSGLAREGVQVIDLSAETTGDSLKHGKFAESPRAVQAIAARLASGHRLEAGNDDTAEGLSTIARGTVNLIGNIVTAPIVGD
ncbi:MAG: alpha/beta hydrolase [Bosea sp. (in: a-proteobacteria)]